MVSQLKGKGVDVKVLCKKIIGNECHKDVSIVEKTIYPLVQSFRKSLRGGAKSVQEQALGSILNSFFFYLQQEDRWFWLPNNSGDFSVSSARSLVDGLLLPTSPIPTKWVPLVPIKVHVFVWKLKRGSDIPSVCCPVCSNWNQLIACSFRVRWCWFFWRKQ
uniref:Reverse transcriptase zinc-binding domain-containing protein n=1 Tax=Lactuca sativa TaxID=4236 RepID=A0A9R1XYD5_LACSA|nr:hypothetical protein LSAT_V11C100032150 [Lactuca sativa]